jgi:hypothetical protein
MKNFVWLGLFGVNLILMAGCATQHGGSSDSAEIYNAVTDGQEIVLKNDRFDTPRQFRPPVEITIVAKTDSTNLRIGYAADQVIFNWEEDRNQLRVDGGPADGQHRPGAGGIPMGKFVTIRWLVLTNRQAIYVDDDLRFEHSGDYSGINKCVSVFSAAGAKVTVRSITVKQLPVSHPAKTEMISTEKISGWIAQLGDPDFSKRNAAVKLLAQYPVETLPALQQALKTETDEDRRWWIQSAIQECQNPAPGD